jgi:hypothetical protein
MPFDLISETWGPAITTIGPTAQMTMYAFIRPDTTIFIIYYALFGNVSRLRGTYWNGAAWHASIDLGSNSLAFVPSGNIGVTASSATMDSGGTIHMVYESGNTDLFYQAFLPSNVLGQFNHFGTFAALGLSSVPGDMAIFKNSLLVPYSTNGFINSTILVGTPLNAPVWTVYNPPAMTYPGGLIDVSGVIVADGTNAYWITNFATDITFAFIAFQMFISQDGTNWSVVPDNSTAPYLYDFAVSPLAPNTDTSFGVANSTAMIVTTASGSTVYAMTLVKSTRGPLTTTYVLNAEFFPLAPSGPTSSPILNPAELPVVVLPNPRVKC